MEQSTALSFDLYDNRGGFGPIIPAAAARPAKEALIYSALPKAFPKAFPKANKMTSRFRTGRR